MQKKSWLQLYVPLVVSHILSNSKINIPCLWMTCKNLIMTLEDGLINTCLFPALAALLMLFKASAKTEVLVILKYCY